MPPAKKPQLLRSATSAASNLLKAFKSKTTTSAAVKEEDILLKSYISSINNSPKKKLTKPLKKENLTEITFRSSLYSGAFDVEDESSRSIADDITSILCGETDHDYQDTSYGEVFENVLHNPWFSSFSSNRIYSCLKEISKERKEKWVHRKNQDVRFNQLVKMCGNKLGVVDTLTIFGKLGRETGMKEYKALFALIMKGARETDDPEVQSNHNWMAYQLFQTMKEMGFPIEEEVYGPFLKYLTDEHMDQEFYFFSDIFKHGNPASLPRLAYYEMLLCIRLNNEDKINQLIYDYSIYDGEDKHSFQESYLLALYESDRRRELLILLETYDVTKASSEERLSDIFKSLGMLSLEAYAEKFLVELKTSGAELATLTNYIYDYATNIPNFTVEDAVSKFKQLHSEIGMKPTSTQYEKLIRLYCKLLKVHMAIDLADEIFDVGYTVSLETIHALLDACMESYEYNMVHRIYSIIRRQGLQPNSETFRGLISLTVKLKDFNGAYDMLREMAEMNIAPTINIYNSIMAGYFREKNIHSALAVLKQMEKADVKPNSSTFSYLISNCSSKEEIVKIFDEMKQSGVLVTKHVLMALINAFAACGEFENAKQVVLDGLIPVKNLNEMRSVLVSALASHGQLSDALTIYEEIKQAGCSLEPKAALALIEHIKSEGQLDRLLQLLEKLQDQDYWIDGCYRVLMYCVHHNHLSSAVDLLKKIKNYFADDEVAAENILDEVFIEFVNQKPKDMQFGLELLRAIKEEIGLRPSRKVLDFLLDACVSADDLKTAFFIWKEYQMAGLPYNILSFLRMYRTLLALGDVKSAEEIVKKIPQDDLHISYVISSFQDTYLRADLLEKSIERSTKKNKQKKKSKATKA
ncbi:hypothetical protein Leryth_005059 [Lithospermum erythrorhizon]|nr:hypothetical protein Leryth_005059 [Lithospermum erythrorhizon]